MVVRFLTGVILFTVLFLSGFSQTTETEKILKTFHSVSSHDLLIQKCGEARRSRIALCRKNCQSGFFVSNGKSYPKLFSHFETANEKYLHREMAASEQRTNYGRPRSDASLFENAGIPTFSLWTQNSVHPVYYHDPRDTPEVLTPEIMEDAAAKLLYLGVLGVANDSGL
jgi:hypothetical protein